MMQTDTTGKETVKNGTVWMIEVMNGLLTLRVDAIALVLKQKFQQHQKYAVRARDITPLALTIRLYTQNGLLETRKVPARCHSYLRVEEAARIKSSKLVFGRSTDWHSATGIGSE